MKKRKCPHCEKTFMYIERNYYFFVSAKGRIVITLICPECDKDIEFKIIEQSEFVSAE